VFNSINTLTKKIDKFILTYTLCIPLVFVNESFLASANIWGFVLYLRSKKNISIKKLGDILSILNLTVIIILIVRIYNNNELVRVWGKKLGKDIIVHGFNNPNTEAEFYYFCILCIWFIIKNRYSRMLFVTAITTLAFFLTSNRSYTGAAAILLMFDIFPVRKYLQYCKLFLIVIPILVTILSFIIGYFTRGLYINSIDPGLAGRFFLIGYVMNNLNLFDFLFGNRSIMANGRIALDVSVFAIFATRGIVMLIFMLVCYTNYIKYINKNNCKYLPAIMSIVIAGITLPMLAWFSINMIILLVLLEYTRRTSCVRNNNYCSGL
jgi:hypothetical protein